VSTVGGSAVVTGAARGFGLEIARRLRRRGYSVVMGDIDGDAVAVAAASLGDGAVGVAGDVRDPEAHRRFASEAASLGPLAVWVNNAGVAPTAKAWEHGDEEVCRTVDINVLGVMHGSRAAVEAMGSRGGRILNVASLAAHGRSRGWASMRRRRRRCCRSAFRCRATCSWPGCRSRCG